MERKRKYNKKKNIKKRESLKPAIEKFKKEILTDPVVIIPEKKQKKKNN